MNIESHKPSESQCSYNVFIRLLSDLIMSPISEFMLALENSLREKAIFLEKQLLVSEVVEYFSLTNN